MTIHTRKINLKYHSCNLQKELDNALRSLSFNFKQTIQSTVFNKSRFGWLHLFPPGISIWSFLTFIRIKPDPDPDSRPFLLFFFLPIVCFTILLELFDSAIASLLNDNTLKICDANERVGGHIYIDYMLLNQSESFNLLVVILFIVKLQNLLFLT